MPTIGEIVKAKSVEVTPTIKDVAVFIHFVKERKNQLDLLRELLSNAGAAEVAASKIEISYTRDKEGHVFEIADDGCGMYYTNDTTMPGRLNKFLGLAGVYKLKPEKEVNDGIPVAWRRHACMS